MLRGQQDNFSFRVGVKHNMPAKDIFAQVRQTRLMGKL